MAQNRKGQPLPPSHPKFRHLDSIQIKLDEQPRQPMRAILQVRRGMIQRNIPPYHPSNSMKGGQ